MCITLLHAAAALCGTVDGGVVPFGWRKIVRALTPFFSSLGIVISRVKILTVFLADELNILLDDPYFVLKAIGR